MTTKRTILRTVLPAFVMIAASPALVAEQSPYAGVDDRAIASLSEQDVDDLVNGRGWGLALPAELNGYPGPVHVLELSDDLSLSDTQRERTRQIFEQMQAEARETGAEYVEIERHIDETFRSGRITEDRITMMTDHSGRLLAKLRGIHLSAHLKMQDVLSPDQTALYNEIRGYGSSPHDDMDHDHHDSHSGATGN